MNIRKMAQLKKLLQGIQVIRPPKYRLSTFGSSQISYFLVTNVPGFFDRCRVRQGEVSADRPQLLTAQVLKEKFFGFGDTADDLMEALVQQYGDALRALEYQFHNELSSNRIELIPPDQLLQNISRELDSSNTPRTALIHGPEKYWELSIMKFIVEETMTSFASNVKELQERGFFDGENRELSRRHREIQTLLEKARSDRAVISILGKKLKEYGLFEIYQDQFFKLVNP